MTDDVIIVIALSAGATRLSLWEGLPALRGWMIMPKSDARF
jgi:hypothetical protein